MHVICAVLPLTATIPQRPPSVAYDDYPSREFVAPWDNEVVVEVNVGPPKCYVLLPKRDHDLIVLQTTSAQAYRRAVILAARVTSHVGFTKLLGKE